MYIDDPSRKMNAPWSVQGGGGVKGCSPTWSWPSVTRIPVCVGLMLNCMPMGRISVVVPDIPFGGGGGGMK